MKNLIVMILLVISAPQANAFLVLDSIWNYPNPALPNELRTEPAATFWCVLLLPLCLANEETNNKTAYVFTKEHMVRSGFSSEVISDFEIGSLLLVELTTKEGFSLSDKELNSKAAMLAKLERYKFPSGYIEVVNSEYRTMMPANK